MSRVPHVSKTPRVELPVSSQKHHWTFLMSHLGATFCPLSPDVRSSMCWAPFSLLTVFCCDINFPPLWNLTRLQLVHKRFVALHFCFSCYKPLQPHWLLNCVAVEPPTPNPPWMCNDLILERVRLRMQVQYNKTKTICMHSFLFGHEMTLPCLILFSVFQRKNLDCGWRLASFFWTFCTFELDDVACLDAFIKIQRRDLMWTKQTVGYCVFSCVLYFQFSFYSHSSSQQKLSRDTSHVEPRFIFRDLNLTRKSNWQRWTAQLSSHTKFKLYKIQINKQNNSQAQWPQ